MSITMLALAAVGCVAGLLGSAAEPVTLSPGWAVGEQRRIDMSAEYEQSGSGAEASARRLAQSARLLLTVAEVDPSGGATLVLTFESLRTEASESGGPAEVFAWNASEPAMAPEGMLPSALERVSAALVGAKAVVTVDARGAVMVISGLAPVTGAIAEVGADEQAGAVRGLGFFSPARLRSNLAKLWQVDPQGKPREPGAQWRASERLEMGGLEFGVETAWTLLTVAEGVAHLTGTVTVEPAPATREADAGDPRLEIRAQEGRVTAEWDVAEGALRSRTEERSMTWGAVLDLGPGATERVAGAESTAKSTIRISRAR